MSEKLLQVVFALVFTTMIVAPPAFAETEAPKVSTGFADKYLSGTPLPEAEDPIIRKRTTLEAEEGFLLKFGQTETLFESENSVIGAWRGDTGTEDAVPWILKALVSEDSAVSYQRGPAGGMSFESTGILVGLRYTFSGFRFEDFRRSMSAFFKNFDVTAPRDIKNVSIYVAFPEF